MHWQLIYVKGSSSLFHVVRPTTDNTRKLQMSTHFRTCVDQQQTINELEVQKTVLKATLDKKCTDTSKILERLKEKSRQLRNVTDRERYLRRKVGRFERENVEVEQYENEVDIGESLKEDIDNLISALEDQEDK